MPPLVEHPSPSSQAAVYPKTPSVGPWGGLQGRFWEGVLPKEEEQPLPVLQHRALTQPFNSSVPSSPNSLGLKEGERHKSLGSV